jgi:hypothetical protein
MLSKLAVFLGKDALMALVWCRSHFKCYFYLNVYVINAEMLILVSLLQKNTK